MQLATIRTRSQNNFSKEYILYPRTSNSDYDFDLIEKIGEIRPSLESKSALSKLQSQNSWSLYSNTIDI